jgi:hypothetical protein
MSLADSYYRVEFYNADRTFAAELDTNFASVADARKAAQSELALTGAQDIVIVGYPTLRSASA